MKMNYCFNHTLYSLGFVILTISVLQSGIKPVESTALSLRNSIDNQNYCQLQLFQIQSLRGRPDKIFNNKRIRKFRRGKDKSARTIGNIDIFIIDKMENRLILTCWQIPITKFHKFFYISRSLLLEAISKNKI